MATGDGRAEILLVEDNPTDAELCLRSLRRNNVANNIVWVRDGAEALDYLFLRGAYSGRDPDETPSVVLLDLRLPKVEGREVLRQIKRDARLKSIPIVVLTSSREDQDINRCYDLGANSFVVKPVEFRDFAETVAKLGHYWALLNTPPQTHLKIIPPAGERDHVRAGRVDGTKHHIG
jgi:two-component system response regulator